MIKFGFQSSKYNHLTLEQEFASCAHERIDFFDVFFDGFKPSDINNVLLPENFSVHFPIDFGKLSEEEQAEYIQFVNEKKPKFVTVHFDNLSSKTLKALCMKLKNVSLCIENSIPNENEETGLSYIEYMKYAENLSKEVCTNIYSTLDTGHCKLNGFNPVEYASKLIEQKIKIMTVHLHDNDGLQDLHLPAGSVNNGIDFASVMKTVGNSENDVYCVIEHWNNNYNALEYLRNL